MKDIKPIFFGLLLLTLPGLIYRSQAQVSISGPACVLPGTSYQYTITGKWDSASTMRVCLTGGKISELGISCTPNGTPISYIRVTWDTASTGQITVNSSLGDSSLAVQMTSRLDGGVFDDSSRNQSIGYNSMAGALHCSPSAGGSCSPHFAYQWQQSADKLHWTDLPGATAQDCVLSTALQQTIYYRRTTTETNSTLVAYSDIAMIVVAIPIPE